MRQILAKINLLVCLACTGVPASANCVTIDQLDKLHALQSRLARDPNEVMFSTNIRQLRNIQQGISNRTTLTAVDGNAFTSPGADFMRFMQNTQRLLKGVSLDDPQSVRRHFDTAARDNLRRIQEHLIDLRCNADQIAVAAAAAAAIQGASGGSSDAEDLADVAETMSALAEDVFQFRTLIVIASLPLALKFCIPRVKRWRVLRRRKAKRHNTTYQVRYFWGDRKAQGMLIDVNCYGTKLRHEPDSPIPPGTLVSIEICDGWTEGTVMWSNTHYSGVQFRRAIHIDDVDNIRSHIQADLEAFETQNGAPKDAA